MGTVWAFIGSFVGKRVLQKITLRTVQIIRGDAAYWSRTGVGSYLALTGPRQGRIDREGSAQARRLVGRQIEPLLYGTLVEFHN